MSEARRKARIDITSSAAGMDRGIGDARRKMRSFQRDTVSEERATARELARIEKAKAKARADAFKSLNSKVGGFAAGAIGGVAAVAGVGGLTSMATDLLDFEKNMTRLQISGEMSNATLATFRARIAQVSGATGRAREDVLEVASAFIRQTGDTENASKQLELFTKVMQATGSNAETTAGVFALMEKSLHLDPKDWEKGVDMLIRAGHMGGAELAQFADAYREAGSEYAAMFAGGDTLQGQQHAIALFQKLVDLTGNAGVAADRFKETLSDLSKDAKKLKEHLGINPYKWDPKAKKEVLRDGIELLHDLKNKLARDPKHQLEMMQKLFPDQRGRGAIEFLVENIEGVDQLNAKLADSGQLQKDYDTYSQSSAARMEKAWNDVKLALTDVFTEDRIKTFASAIEKVLGAVVTIIDKIESFVHQPTQAEGTNAVRASLAGQVMTGGREAAIQRAKDAMGMSEKEYNQLAMRNSGEGREAASAGNYANYVGGMRQFLGEQGYEMDKYGLNVQARTVDAATRDARLAGSSGDIGALAVAINALSRSIARQQSQPINVTVKADGSVMAKTVANASYQRKLSSIRGG